MAGGSFSFSSSPSVSRYTPTGQARVVVNVGLVPEVIASSCLCKSKASYGMDGLALTDGGEGVLLSRCEASSSWGRYSELDGCEVLRFCCDPSSSTVAGDHLVLNRPKSSLCGTFMLDAFNASCNSNCASPCISWNGQTSQSLSAYMDNTASCTTANMNLLSLPDESIHDSNAQRTSYSTHVRSAANPSQGRCHEFKPDDASSHTNNNNNHNIMLCNGSGDLEGCFPTDYDRDLEVEELAGLSESINDSLLQEEQQKARGDERMSTFVVKGGSKRKAEASVKTPRGAAEVQSKERSFRIQQNESRIVRVSRLTGGKDRHSKVRTARGLRDRRVRLSVPTAIQFYDLQDRLGYEQPSMAVDWLINAAKAAIDDLPPISDGDASNIITYSNCSPVKSGVESPKDSATTVAVARLTAHEVGVKNQRKIHEQLPIKDSYVRGRSSSSTSDGSIMGTEYSSKSSLSKLARLKVARERARKKARNSSQVPSTTNMLQSSVTGHLMSDGSVLQESFCGRNEILSGTTTTSSIQEVWDYNMQDISCKDHSRQFQHMPAATLSSTLLQQQSSAEMHPFLRSSSHQSFDMADLTTAFMDPKQRSVVGNAAQMYLNSFIDHQSQAMQKHIGSTFVPTISSDVNFTTSDRGPLQSNSSCITTANTPLLQKNAFADASAKVSMLPYLAYDSRIPERFQTYFLEGNGKYGVNY